MAAQKTGQSLSVVIRGAFNPPIFQPAWLAQEGLMREGEAKDAQIEVIHAEVTVFTTDWLRCQVTRDRFNMQTERESHYEPLRDLVSSVFSLLRHTPTRVCGVNHTEVLQYRDRDAFDQLGWRLVPTDPWDGVLERPGVLRLDEMGLRTDEREGFVRVRVEPRLDGSLQVEVEVNDHFVVSATDSQESTAEIARLLLEEWGQITERAQSVHSRIRELVV